MKKVLFATTALVATAGVAAADVTFGGYGRFGIKYDEDASSTDLTTRMRLQIDATAESDAGVVFGARARINADGNGVTNGAGADFNGVRYFARSGGFEVGVGNIFGALESMPGQYPIDLGLTGLGYDYTAFSGADAYTSTGDGAPNGVEVLYSAGDLSVHVSASDMNDRIAGYVAYTWSGWTFAVGGQDSDDATDNDWTATAGGSFGIADVTLAYADNGGTDRVVLAGRFDVGAATDIEVYVADQDGSDTGYGIDFNHDLGGGTSLRGGVAKRFDGNTQADMGVRFNF
ncbi:Porin [Sulfitobacter indolifex]|uniref:Outer membrane porin n=2 Tax=root TaxID=1 RepID=A0ABP2DE19_9RHOB|nr:porin [Sulfitobacter indolifex]EDQ06659.1 outer membrane porin [Sulfitobacter indolifex HEL-45]UOA17648.1 Porin [Sulfitobacter indolifex]